MGKERMSELIACPFCGNEKGDDKNDAPHVCYTESNTQHQMAHCERCGAKINAYTYTVVAERWNTRPIEDALLARIASLEAEQIPDDALALITCWLNDYLISNSTNEDYDRLAGILDHLTAVLDARSAKGEK
jgi:hypothetical protein